jgi:hypothetical protein
MKRCTRRQFTLGLGASLILAPFLDLLNGTAQAGPQKGAKRLIIFFSPNGTIPRLWRPSGSETSFTFPTGSVLTPLAPIMSDVIVLDGIDFVNVNNHQPGMSNMLTGGGAANNVGAGMSVDQYIASQVGQGSRFPSLEFGVETSAWGGNAQTRMCYSAPNTFVTPEDDPVNAYSRMFGDVAGPQAAKLLAKRKSTLDLIRAEIGDLQTRLGAQERIKLDQHLTALRQTEQSLTNTNGCVAPTAPTEVDDESYPNFPAIGKAHMDLMVTALSCGMTNVASIQWSHTVGPHVFSWIGITDGHHDLSHSDDSNTQGVANFIACETWYATQFTYLVNSLKNTPDPAGGTMLDSTLVVWCKELGDSRLHVCTEVPFVLAGSAGGLYRTGRYLKLNNAPHQQLLTSICQAMGLSNQSFGDPTAGTGPLVGLV